MPEKLKPASIWRRFAAKVIDVGVMIGLALLSVMAGAFLDPPHVERGPRPSGYLALASLGVWFLYFVLSDAVPFMGAQTLGKRLLRLRVVRVIDHKPIQGMYLRSFGRQIWQLVPILALADALCIFGVEHRRLGDYIAGTAVIDEPARPDTPAPH